MVKRTIYQRGNVDLVPTILQILGIKVPHQMDGRILSEAVAAPTSLLPAPKPEAKSIEARKAFSDPARGDKHFKSRASVRRSISTKATAPLLRLSQQLTNYSAIAERIASIGASRLNQTENDSAP